jgi:hypothetical protein
VLFALAWLGCGWTAGSAAASDLLDGLGQSYFEDFEDELAFPLTPEVDSLGLGGMMGHRTGDPLPLLPTLSGGELLIFVSEAVGSGALLQSSGAQVPFEPALAGRVGLRGRFDGFETVADVTNNSFLTAAVTLADREFPSGVAAYLLDFQTGGLRIAVSSVGLQLSGFDTVFVSSTAEDAIRDGDPFEIELLFDLTDRTAQAALTVGGEIFQTDATTSAIFDALDIGFAVVANTNSNNEAPLATIASDVQDFAIFVPAPGSGAAALAAGVTLAALRARAGRVR